MKLLSLIKRTHGERILLSTLIKQVTKSLCGRPIPHTTHITDIEVDNSKFSPTIKFEKDLNIDAYYYNICSLFMEHKFDLLGSGWICVNQEKTANNSYNKIDWHKDWKSGYKFDQSLKSERFQKLKFPNGVDVKYPWELARMQHLPILAITAIKDSTNADKYFNEFKNEIIDFIGSNPVAYGINWTCPMDVALRAVSWLIAYDIFYTSVGKNDTVFHKLFTRSILEHGDFIYHNLEKNFTEDKSGNHYLSDLLGLLCIGHYFHSKKSNKWFQFAAREYKREIVKQYLPDGGNYEFSTAYHRLDSELTALSISFMLANKIAFSNIETERLSRTLDVMYAIIGRDGNIIQIGDNDNGHAAIFSAVYNANICKNELSGDAAINMLNAIFGLYNSTIESKIIHSIIADHQNLLYSKREAEFIINHYKMTQLPYFKSNTCNILSGKVLGIEIFEHFGLVKFKTDTYDLYVRTPIDTSLGKTTHIHADCLHTEVVTNSERLFADQGSYVYTPNVNMRNVFRQDSAHNIPRYNIPQLDIQSCWNVRSNTSGKILDYGDNYINIVMKLHNITHIRHIDIHRTNITISDYSNTDFSATLRDFEYTSNGYGNIQQSITTKYNIYNE